MIFIYMNKNHITEHNDLNTNKNYFDFLSPVASFGPK